MSGQAEREWLVYLIGPAGTIEVTVRSASKPEVGNAQVQLGECTFLRETFAGAFPVDKVTSSRVHLPVRP